MGRQTAAKAENDGELGALHPEKVYLGSPVKTWRKIIPLGLVLFCILFNYTILRDTKVCSAVAWRCGCCAVGAPQLMHW